MHRICGARRLAGAFCLPLLLCVVCGVGGGGCASDRPENYRLRHEYSVDDPQFARAMDSLMGPPILNGNTCTTLLNGERIFPAMLGAIRSAERIDHLGDVHLLAGDDRQRVCRRPGRAGRGPASRSAS